MKQFACGDVVPGCEAQFVCSTDDEILTQVAQHAARAHGLTTVSESVIAAVRASIVSL